MMGINFREGVMNGSLPQARTKLQMALNKRMLGIKTGFQWLLGATKPFFGSNPFSKFNVFN